MKILEITTNIGCVNNCSYCPQELIINKYKSGKMFMNLTDFSKILTNVPKDVEIMFAGFSEPFLASECFEMINLSLSKGYVTSLYTTLVGIRIPKDNRFKSDNPLKSIHIHKTDAYSSTYMETIKEKLLQNINTQKITEGFVENKISRAGTLFNRIDLKCDLACSVSDFDHNVVLPNGDVYLCCMDYGLKHKIGNIFESNFNELDRNSVIFKASAENSDLICRKCEFAIEKSKKI